MVNSWLVQDTFMRGGCSGDIWDRGSEGSRSEIYSRRDKSILSLYTPVFWRVRGARVIANVGCRGCLVWNVYLNVIVDQIPQRGLSATGILSSDRKATNSVRILRQTKEQGIVVSHPVPCNCFCASRCVVSKTPWSNLPTRIILLH